MTVRELIEELQKLPEEALEQEILVFADGNKPEYQHYDIIVAVDYDPLWYDETHRKCPVIHID